MTALLVLAAFAAGAWWNARRSWFGWWVAWAWYRIRDLFRR